MGFFDSFKKKSDNQQENDVDKDTSLTKDNTEEIVDDKVYVRDVGQKSYQEENQIRNDKIEDDHNTESKEEVNNKEVKENKEEYNNNAQESREVVDSSTSNDNTSQESKEVTPKTIPSNVKRSQYAPEIKIENNKPSNTEIKDESSNTSDNNSKAKENTESNSTESKSSSDNSSKNTIIISILNQKGGVGKSTTAINLAAALGELGKKCLLVDLDPQGNTSSGLGIEKNKLNKCIYDVLLHDTQLDEVIVNDVCHGVDVVPATINLAGAEVELVSEIAREQRLKDALVQFDKEYDFIFVDCPPSLGLLTVNALVAADQLIIPIQCEFYALEGVTKLLDSMKRVKNRLNRDLDIYGVVLTMYDNRTTLSKQVAEEVQNFFGDKVFKSKIPRTVKISEAPSFGIPINEYEPLCKGTIMYESLAEEVIERGN